MMLEGIGALGKLHCTQRLSLIGHMLRAQPAAAKKVPSATIYDGTSISSLAKQLMGQLIKTEKQCL